MKIENEKLPCYNCQGGGCPACSGYGWIYGNVMRYYSESELVKFGKYLLSEKREQSIRETNDKTFDERKRFVYVADIANSGIIETDLIFPIRCGNP